MLRILSSEERVELSSMSKATASAPTSLPEEYLAMAYRIAKIHGNVRWARAEGKNSSEHSFTFLESRTR